MSNILPKKSSHSAILSEATYGKTTPPGFERLESGVEAGYGFDASVFRHKKSGEIYIAYRGTDGLSDMFANTGIATQSNIVPNIGTAGLGIQLAKAEAVYKQIEARYPGASINLTGHSLGGGLAQVVGSKHDVPTETFSAPGMKTLIERYVPNPKTGQIINHMRESDPVAQGHNFTKELLSGEHVGRTLVYPSANKTFDVRGPNGESTTLLPTGKDIWDAGIFSIMPGAERGLGEHSMTYLAADIVSGIKPISDSHPAPAVDTAPPPPAAPLGATEAPASPQIDDKSNWLRPGGDGSISDGPTAGNWGGGGFSGGQRDPTPVCRADWVPPASKMDEAFRNHDYAYMRNGLDADTPQSDPFKQEADLQLLKELREIPDSELTPQALLYKTGAELIFGKKTSGEFDPALVEKFQNIPSESLDLEQKLAQALGGTYAEGNILWGDAEKAAGALYESVSTMAGEAADAAGKMIDDAGNYMSKQAEDASNWIDKSATELRQGFDGLFGKEPDVPGGGGGGGGGGETWGGGGGSFSGGGSSGSWGDGMSSGLGRGSSDKSINVMAGEAETAVGNAEAGASRAENAADRASSALNRAIDARNRLLAKVRGTSCWVARSVYGESAPEWRVFRSWLLSSAPGWLRNPYLLHGPAAAAWLDRHPVWKPPLRGVMDYVVARHRCFLEAPPAGQEGRFRRALRWLR